MTNAACTRPSPYNCQIALNDYADYLVCSKCKRVYWNDMDDIGNVNMIDVHPFWGNGYMNLMARSGRKDLVQKAVQEEQKRNAKTMDEMKAEYIKNLDSETE